MGTSKVFFIRVNDGKNKSEVNPKLLSLLEKSAVFSHFDKDSFTAVKLHFGEEENAGFVNPAFLKVIVEELKKKKCRAFLTDTNALYKGSRTNAVEHLALAYRHGFLPSDIGAPVIIADGLHGDEYAEVIINKGFIKTAYVASAIQKADALVAVSHFKGHIMTGFGGAVKNLGMGCAARRGKLVQHGGMAPVIRKEKCIACERCVAVCPVTAIAMKQKKAEINPALCIGCASCIAVCPVAAIDVAWEKGADTISQKMAEYALAAVHGKKDSCACITFATKITKECDCLAKDDPAICPDIGIFASFDPVAIDQACVDMVNKVSGGDLFAEQHPDRGWRKQLEHAEEIGLGSRRYELIEVT